MNGYQLAILPPLHDGTTHYCLLFQGSYKITEYILLLETA